MFHVKQLYNYVYSIAIILEFDIIIYVTTTYSNEPGQGGNTAALS